MALRSVLAPTTQPEENQTASSSPRWMHRFFTRDLSPDNLPLIDLQRRGVWIGLACILQALDEIDHSWYIPYLMPFGSLIPLALLLGSFVALWMAFRPARIKQQARRLAEHPRRWQRILLTLTLVLTIAGGIELGRAVVMAVLPPQFSNDGTSLDTNAADLLLHGRNPYTDSSILDIVRRFSIQPTWTTPLRAGQFANRLDYPTQNEFQAALDTALKSGQAPEFESRVSYPALSFLTLVPFVLLHNYNVLPFYLLSYLLLIGLAWRVVRPEMRSWVLLLGMANVPMWASTVGGNLDIFATLLVFSAWLVRDRRWASTLFLGLAIATKQTVWFLLPFYFIMVWRHYSLPEAIRRMTIVGIIGLAINLPFILWNPQAWLAGVLAPIADPMFPLGDGIINLSVTHLLPFFPGWVYQALEGGAMLASLAWYWRICRERPEAALLLAVLPLFLAWRSLPSYFYCVAYPMFILMAARPRKRPGTKPHLALSVLTREKEAVLADTPATLGARAAFQHML
ncbi:MAG: glycosyltransferase 87 family protein [Ktedonobacteraceae bacterium]